MDDQNWQERHTRNTHASKQASMPLTSKQPCVVSRRSRLLDSIVCCYYCFNACMLHNDDDDDDAVRTEARLASVLSQNLLLLLQINDSL